MHQCFHQRNNFYVTCTYKTNMAAMRISEIEKARQSEHYKLKIFKFFKILNLRYCDFMFVKLCAFWKFNHFNYSDINSEWHYCPCKFYLS
jgi:hypothetical protein